MLLVGVAVYAYAFRSTLDLKSIRGDALATLFYVSNWHFIVSDQGYFAQAAAPSPLLHTWSLAVEEQYYLIWPLIALIVVRLRGINALAIVAAMGAGASALLMGTMYWAGVSVDRLYYGTDTRAQALLIGSFLGAVGSHTGSRFNILPTSWTRSRLQQRFWVLLGIVGAIFLVWAWHDLQGQTSALYVGGFFCVGLAVASVIVACITFPASMLARLCSLSVLVYIGRISYGLYLYHWPLFLAIDHAHTGLMGFPLLVARLAATFCAASISFFAIEEPIRRRRVLKGRIAWPAMGAAVVVSVVALFFATVTPALATVPVRGANAMTTAETRSLRAAGAFTTHPIKFLLLGDSIALTLGTGLSNRSVSRYGVEMIDKGAVGCDLDSVEVNLSGSVGPATPGCLHWRTDWTQYIAQDRPDVVGLLIGRWEVSDHLYDGHWVHVGEASWDEHITSELNQAFGILSSKGARIIVFTMPYVDPPNEAANGTPFSENTPTRTAFFNKLLLTTASRAVRKGDRDRPQ